MDGLRPALFATALLLTLLASSAQAAPSSKEQSTFKGLGGSTTAFYQAGCTSVSFNFFGSESLQRFKPFPKLETNFVSFFGQVTDSCTGAIKFVFAFGEGLAVSGNVNTGIRFTGLVTGTVSDAFGSSIPINGTVDVLFIPTAKPEHMHSNNMFANGTIYQRFHQLGLSAPAAPTGAIVIDGVDYLAAAIAAGVELNSTINSSQSGSLTIFR
jgi:hypothetical protein